ncbi:MAG: hypothetical protein ABL999_20075 [Pyrinomonadaceae bacterium]
MSHRNPAIAFRLLEPKAELTAADGSVYTRVTDAEIFLPSSQVQLGQDIKGTQTIEKEIVFDLPAQAADLKLLITEGYGVDKYVEAVLVDDEDSILHKKNYFQITEQKETAGVK